jgi:anti-sigma factor RsiW
MDYESQLKLQALLDGELSEAKASEMNELLARDPEAAALLQELRNTRAALGGSETGIRLPESREFFWSKVQREIERLETPAAKPAAAPFSALLRRLLVPASAIAVLVISVLVLNRPTGPGGLTPAAEIETALADSGAFTYRDYSAGTTLVWLSYPADTEAVDDDEMGTVE